MIITYRSIKLLSFLSIFIFCFSSCWDKKNDSSSQQKSELSKLKVAQPDAYDEMKKRGTLIALTNFNSTDYFVYRGTPMGYQYDLLQAYAKHEGVKLDIKVSNNLAETFEILNNGECELVAKNLTITKQRSKIVSFTYPHNQTRQVLVQRKPYDWIRKTQSDIDESLLRNQIDLAGKRVYVQKNTSFGKRLRNLAEEIGDSIHIIETSLYGVEELVGLVARGKIDYTVCDENVGIVNSHYFPILDVKTPISFKQNVAWAIRKDSKKMQKSVNRWMRKFIRTNEYKQIYYKYFRSSRTSDRIKSEYFSLTGGRISIYDEVIKEASQIIPWDWRLLASLVRTESNFNPQATSWAGAYGLMQIMPSNFELFGVNKNSSPTENIVAGVKYIKWLDDRYKDKIINKHERVKYILASYNVGQGHIDDAMRLAEKYDKDPYTWDDNVEFFLKNKTNPRYYNEDVVKYGYCRGDIAVIYVNEILERFEHYKHLINE